MGDLCNTHLLLCALINRDPGAVRLHALLVAGLEVQPLPLCSDTPAAVVTGSLLSWLPAASLEMFSRLKNSRRYIPKMQGNFPGGIYLSLRSGAEGREGIAARCMLRGGSCPRCTGRGSPVLHHQPAGTLQWKRCLGFPSVWVGSGPGWGW